MTDYSLEKLEQLHGFQIDAYLVALQGWQRGLHLKFHTRRPGDVYFANDTIPNEFPGIVFTLTGDNSSHTFYRTRGDKTLESAIDLCADKLSFKRHLEFYQFNTPKGGTFHIDDEEDIIHFAETIGYPVVLKPASGSMGRGVTADIPDKNALKTAVTSLKENFPEYKQVIVESFFRGEDYRLYVVGDTVTAAYTRTPAAVVGDGESTVRMLINARNIVRKSNPNTRNKLIIIDPDVLHHLKSQGVGLDDVPAMGREVYLRRIPNISLGGNPKDVTNTLPENIKTAVVEAVKSIEGLPNAGVDVLINEHGEFTIIEMNSVAVITSHVFPIEGEAIDVPEKIIDYYFPETKHKARTPMTFNYRDVINNLASGNYDNISIKSVPVETAPSIKLSFKSTVPWINIKAIQSMLQMYDFHGELTVRDDTFTMFITRGTIPVDSLIEHLKTRYLFSTYTMEETNYAIKHAGIHIKKDVPN